MSREETIIINTIEIGVRSFGKELDTMINKALKEGGSFVVKEAKKRVPVKTGRTKDSVTYKLKGSDTSVNIFVPYNIVDPETKARYPMQIHESWDSMAGLKAIARADFRSMRTGKTVGQDWLLRAITEEIEPIKDIFIKTIKI